MDIERLIEQLNDFNENHISVLCGSGGEDLGGEQVKVYIAGKITGDPNYQKKFQWAQEDLEGQGFTVLNPAELPEGMRPADYMRICMAMMDSADIVAFLPDYEQSRGAQLEWAWCQYVGKQTMYLESMTFYRPYPKTERKKGDEFPW